MILDEFFIALGFKVDPAGIAQVERSVATAKASLMSLGASVHASSAKMRAGVLSYASGLGLAAAGIGAMVTGAVMVGNQWEQNKIQIAGFLNALGVSGTFEEGLTEASRVMQKIVKDAALLPGTAQEYIDVFKTAFPVIKEAMKGSTVNQMVEFSNRLAAYGKSQNLDSGTTGRETQMLLAAHGRAGGHNVLWQRMQALLPKAADGTALDPTAFNALSQAKRFEIINAALVKLDPMLKASAKSFDAMWGAVESTFSVITRLATEGLFEAVKIGLGKINDALFDSDGELTAFGREIVADGKLLVKWGGQLVDTAGNIIGWLTDLQGGAKKAMIAGALMFLVWLFPIAALSLGIALLVEDIDTFREGGQSVTGWLVDRLDPALKAIAWSLAAVAAGFALLATEASAAAIKTALAWITATLPLFFTILAIGAVGVAAYELLADWQVITTGLSDLWDDFIDGLELPEWIYKLDSFLGGVMSNVSAGMNGGLDTNGQPVELPQWNNPKDDADRKKREERRAARKAGGGSRMVPQAAGAAGQQPVKWFNSDTGLTEEHPAGWQGPTASMSGEDYATAYGSVNSSRNNTITTNVTNGPVTVNITAPDAEAAGKAVEKVVKQDHRSATRNAQTPKVL